MTMKADKPASCYPEALWTRLVHSQAETEAMAEALGRILRPGDVVLLDGDLGAGKTTFTQRLARTLGVSGPVTSPTFSLVNEYEIPMPGGQEGVCPFYHFDLYRLEWEDELFDIGFDEYFTRGGILVIEWGEKFSHMIDADYLQVHLGIPENGNLGEAGDAGATGEAGNQPEAGTREFGVCCQGERGLALAKEWKNLVIAGN